MIKALTSLRDDNLAKDSLQLTKTELSEKYSTGIQNVTRILKKDRSREIIEKETKKLLGIVPSITKQIKEDVRLSSEISEFFKNPTDDFLTKVEKETIEDDEGNKITRSVVTQGKTPFQNVGDLLAFQTLSYKKQQDVMRSVGIFQGNGTNVFIQQIYNDNRKEVLNPEIFKALSKMFCCKEENEESVQNAEFVVLENEEEKNAT